MCQTPKQTETHFDRLNLALQFYLSEVVFCQSIAVMSNAEKTKKNKTVHIKDILMTTHTLLIPLPPPKKDIPDVNEGIILIKYFVL